MARVVVHTETGSRKIDANDIDSKKGDVAISQWDFAEDYPFCDGSHHVMRDELKDVLYRYNKGGLQRLTVTIVEIDDRNDEDRGNGI